MATSEQVISNTPRPEFAVPRREQLALLRRLLRNRKGLIGTVCLLGLLIVAIFSQYIAHYDPNELHPIDQLAPPSGAYWFGTDELGRDIFSRVVYGTRPAIQAGFLAVFLAATVGAITGLAAAYLGGWFDTVIMRIWDALLAFPTIFLAIGIVTILGPGWVNAVLAIAVINMPVFSRIIRATALSVKGKDFIEAARAIGCSRWRIAYGYLFPNSITSAVVLMAIAVPEAILVEASLSFLGLGSQPPKASWGNMLSAAQAYLTRSGTYAIFPGVAITVAVIGMSFFADGLQDALDPRRIRAAGS